MSQVEAVEEVSGDTSEKLLVEKLRRYGKRFELCYYMLSDFRFDRLHREIVSPAILKAVLNIYEVIPNDPNLNARLYKAVTNIMKKLDVDDLTFELGQQVMQYTLSYRLRFKSDDRLLRLLISRFGIIPDGTYLNIQSDSSYILFLITYIEESSANAEEDHFISMLYGPTGRFPLNPKVIWLLYESLEGSENARALFRIMDALSILGRVERVSLPHLHKYYFSLIIVLISLRELVNWCLE
ncbi:unnamed protein product [Rodentolepis nana]|uniref:CNOT1_CAF1_bind domain-containing protein n=1 Tax=Rodentolepis nana TaxID=102285 RepID=A0A0R3TIH5_RODNA|nr:unnamed protein product [Rodentolepis nana]